MTAGIEQTDVRFDSGAVGFQCSNQILHHLVVFRTGKRDAGEHNHQQFQTRQINFFAFLHFVDFLLQTACFIMKFDGFSQFIFRDFDTEVFFGSFDQFIDFFTIEVFGELTAFLRNIHEVISRIAGDRLPVVVDSSGVVAEVI